MWSELWVNYLVADTCLYRALSAPYHSCCFWNLNAIDSPITDVFLLFEKDVNKHQLATLVCHCFVFEFMWQFASKTIIPCYRSNNIEAVNGKVDRIRALCSGTAAHMIAYNMSEGVNICHPKLELTVLNWKMSISFDDVK